MPAKNGLARMHIADVERWDEREPHPSPNNLLLRAVCDKVRAPNRSGPTKVSACALQVGRAAAEQGRYAATASRLLIGTSAVG